MNKKIRNSIIFVFSLLIALSFSFAILSLNNAKKTYAESTPIFQLEDGASVSILHEYTGIRWKTYVNQAYISSLGEYKKLEFGTLVIPANKIIDEADFVFAQGKIEESDEYYKYNGTNVLVLNFVKESDLEDILKNGYFGGAIEITEDDFENDSDYRNAISMQLYAKSYIKVVRKDDNIDYYYSTSDSVRSLLDVALVNYVAKNTSQDTKDIIQSNYLGDNTITIENEENALVVEKFTNQVVTFENTISTDFIYSINGKAINVDSIENNSIVIDASALPVGNAYLCACDLTNNVTYVINLNIIDIITITTAEKLNSILTNASLTQKNLEITYKLGNNIDASGFTFGATNTISEKTIDFTGVFDGQGYTISNLAIGEGGLFGNVNGGTIKNVAFDNVIVSSGCVLGESISSSSIIENVYVNCTSANGSKSNRNDMYETTRVISFDIDWISNKLANLFNTTNAPTIDSLVVYGKVTVASLSELANAQYYLNSNDKANWSENVVKYLKHAENFYLDSNGDIKWTNNKTYSSKFDNVIKNSYAPTKIKACNVDIIDACNNTPLDFTISLKNNSGILEIVGKTIKPVSTGTDTLVFTLYNGVVVKEISVDTTNLEDQPIIKVNGELNVSSLNLLVGANSSITVKNSKNVDFSNITLTTSNSSAVSVSGLTITANSIGVCTINVVRDANTIDEQIIYSFEVLAYKNITDSQVYLSQHYDYELYSYWINSNAGKGITDYTKEVLLVDNGVKNVWVSYVNSNYNSNGIKTELGKASVSYSDYASWLEYVEFIDQNNVMTAVGNIQGEYDNWSDNNKYTVEQYLVYKSWLNSFNCYDMDKSRIVEYTDYEMYLDYIDYSTSNSGTYDIETYIGWINSDEYKANPTTYSYAQYENSLTSAFAKSSGTFTISSFTYVGTNYKSDSGLTLADMCYVLESTTFTADANGNITANMENVPSVLLNSSEKAEVQNILNNFVLYRVSNNVIKVAGTITVGITDFDVSFYLSKNGTNAKTYSLYNTVLSIGGNTTTISMVVNFE